MIRAWFEGEKISETCFKTRGVLQLKLAAEKDGASLSFVSQRFESGTYQLSCLKDVGWAFGVKVAAGKTVGQR